MLTRTWERFCGLLADAKDRSKDMGGMVSNMLTMFKYTCRLFVACWQSDFEAQGKLIEQCKPLFSELDLAANMTLNVVSLNIFHVVLAKLAFSEEMLPFVLRWVVIPSLVGSFAYIHFKFGKRGFSFGSDTVAKWVNNFLAMNGVALVCWTQHALSYVVLRIVGSVLPSWLQGTYAFPAQIMEESFRSIVYTFYIISGIVLMSLPLHKYAYWLNMNLIGRQSELSVLEAFMEIVYHSANSMCVYQVIFPLIILQTKFAPFHVIHLIVSLVESSLPNVVTKFKFCLLHGACHKIKPLYHMAHVEHHICKGVYPNTAAAGLWEFWMLGGSFGFVQLPLASLPYMHFQIIYCGANLLVHTMWPVKSLAQWHTLHHVVNADVYSINIPNEHDRTFSKDYSKFNDLLEKVSPFVRIWWLSDVTAGLMATLAILFFHYGVGVSFFHVMHLAQ